MEHLKVKDFIFRLEGASQIKIISSFLSKNNDFTFLTEDGRTHTYTAEELFMSGFKLWTDAEIEPQDFDKELFEIKTMGYRNG